MSDADQFVIVTLRQTLHAVYGPFASRNEAWGEVHAMMCDPAHNNTAFSVNKIIRLSS